MDRAIWMVRHGETDWNARLLVQGQSFEPGLTDRGFRQARAVAAKLVGRGIGVIWSSDLRRTLQTAHVIAQKLGLEVVSDPRLRERRYGSFEGRPVSELTYEEAGFSHGMVGNADLAPPGGESIRDLYGRAASLLASACQNSQLGDLVLITHGGMIRSLLAVLDGSAPDAMAWPDVENGFVLRRVLSCPQGAQQSAASKPRVQEEALS
jgi:2,3-bisphosphoglycerate-dependent phosphoglycerate mutase